MIIYPGGWGSIFKVKVTQDEAFTFSLWHC